MTHDGQLIMASETGVLPVKPEDVKFKGRLQPGKMLLVDLNEKRIIPDEELKQARLAPALRRMDQGAPDHPRRAARTAAHPRDRHETLLSRQRCFGYTEEDVAC